MSSSQTAVSTSSQALPKVEVTAQVVFSILNAFSRRADKNARVIGTLLGEVSEEGVVNVTECFPVPLFESSSEEDEAQKTLSFDTEYYNAMLSLHRRNNRREAVVGWFTTTPRNGALLQDSTSWVHGFYAGQCALAPAVHLVVDTSLEVQGGNDSPLSVRAFVAAKNSVGDAFFSVESALRFSSEAEAALLRHCASSAVWESGTTLRSGVPAPAQRLHSAAAQLESVLDVLQRYVDGVVSGKVAADRGVGVSLAETLAVAHSAGAAAGVAELNARYQDLVMLAYLSTLAQAQTAVAEKLNQVI